MTFYLDDFGNLGKMHYFKYTKEKAKEEKQWAILRIGAAIFIAAIALTAYVMGCRIAPPAQEEIMQPKIPSIKEFYPQALAEARKWRSDAYMVYAAIYVRHSRMIGSLAFDSESDPEAGFIYRIRENDDGFRTEIKEVDASGRLRANPGISHDEWELDSLDAARIAYENAGRDFLHEHPEVDTVLLQLSRVGGAASERTGIAMNRVVWSVSFYRLRVIYFDIYIDPLTGEVLAIDLQEGGIDLEQLEGQG